jgi:hypothetical protein
LRAERVRTGGAQEVRVFSGTMAVMAAFGLALIAYSLAELA